ncbi:hypothetical protein [Rhizorhabdus sp.]|uniref:hypothetical protein n=1 Tax=Rhizorhabdus sp. TaxID=1968843 RepID=UPI0019A9B2BE|nr:hypothetical protein [Rhizorhabdus sp.]MBD3762619.1 hypothetical protein [Rhizorhabdus sp.]
MAEEPIPARDQIIEGNTAADGGHVPGACNTLGEFVRSIEDGQFDADAFVLLKELNAALIDHAQHHGGKAKGKMSLTFDFTQEGGITEIRSNFKFTMPEEKRPKSVMWMTEDNRPTRTRPGQHQLFGIRDASAPGRAVRDA